MKFSSDFLKDKWNLSRNYAIEYKCSIKKAFKMAMATDCRKYAYLSESRFTRCLQVFANTDEFTNFQEAVNHFLEFEGKVKAKKKFFIKEDDVIIPIEKVKEFRILKGTTNNVIVFQREKQHPRYFNINQIVFNYNFK